MKTAHAKHLAQFNIPRELLDAAKVKSVNDAEAREALGLNGHYENDFSGILFPYFDPITGNRTGARLRLDKPLNENGKGKYLSEKGNRHIFFPPIKREPGDDAPPEALNNPNIQIIVVEAEKSALALTALATRTDSVCLVIAVGGCWGWKRKAGNKWLPDGGHDIETGPSPDFDLVAWKNRKVALAFDSNATTNSDVQRARNALAKELVNRGAKVSFVNIPSDDEVNGPDDLIAKRGDDFTWQVFHTAIPFSLEAIPLIVHDLTDFKTIDFPLRDPLAVLDTHKTTIFSARSLNQIFAWRGTGKTMVSLALSGALATGGKFLNIQAVRQSRVLYVEGETPNAQLQERSRLLIGPTEPGFFRLITLDSQVSGIPALSTASGRKLLEETINDAEILVLDSISTLAWMATNDEEEWIELLHWFAQLRSRGLCLIILHHAGKSGLQRGHSRSEDMLDVSIKLSKPSDDEEVDWLKLKLEYDKFRGDRTGIRSLVVECKGGLWSWSLIEVEKLKALQEYLEVHPNAACRTIARDLPDLGSHTTISKLMRILEEKAKQDESS